MIFEDAVNIITKKRVEDGMGGFTEEKVVIGAIYCQVAPLSVSERQVLKALNPWSSIKLYTEDELPIDVDEEFFFEYNNKVYRKVETVDYTKCIKIIGERYYL